MLPAACPRSAAPPTEDQTLTASTAGIADADGLGALQLPVAAQWRGDRRGHGGTYTLGDADVGTQISVQVAYTDAHGTSEGPLASAQTAPVANVNDAPVGVPTITGTVTEDQTLTANTAGIADADGLGAFSYQWLRDGVAIGGATAGTYTLGDADVGHADQRAGVLHGRPRHRRRAAHHRADRAGGERQRCAYGCAHHQRHSDGRSDAHGRTPAASPTSTVWARSATSGCATGWPSVALPATPTRSAMPMWARRSAYRCATPTDMAPPSRSPAHRLRPVANVNDAPVGIPTIIGTSTEDQTLTANTAGIADADGLGAFSYQWLRNGVAIGGATASTYTLGDADVGTQISVEVSYTDAHGTSEGPLTSAQTAPVANVNDAPAGVPTISGTVTEDQTLTANTGGISDADGLGAFSYQWLRNGIAIGGATTSTYTLGDADVATQISVQVSYTDGQGTAESRDLRADRTRGQRQRCSDGHTNHHRHPHREIRR